MKELLQNNPFILMEAAIVEQLRRSGSVVLDSSLINAPLIFNNAGRAALADIYQSYIKVAQDAALPMMLCTPTWRTNQERVKAAGARSSINIDAVNFLQQLRENTGTFACQIKIGGMIGCKNDAYQPDAALTARAATEFHQWQIKQFLNSSVDYLIAVTLPNVQEALGIARAMAQTAKPYIISFVIRRDGRVLDGTPLSEAIQLIDDELERPPLCFMVNCAYPGFLCASEQPASVFDRLLGIQANASSLNHDELDEADNLEMDDVSEWGQEMVRLNQQHGIKILGGCCGTGIDHLRFLTNRIPGSLP